MFFYWHAREASTVEGLSISSVWLWQQQQAVDSTVTTVTLTDNLSGNYSAGKCLFPEGASYAFDQSWDKPHGTSEGILRAEARTHFTHHSFFQTDFSSMRLWFIDLIQVSDCRTRTSPNSPCVAKFYEDRITIPPRRFKRHVGQKSPLVSEDWQADFQWKIDALLMLWPSEKGRIYAYWATYYHQFQNRGTTFFRHKKSP